MRVAIDNLEYLNKIKDKEVIYVFDDNTTLQELVDTGLHCIHKDYIEDVDINLTDYAIPCIKKCSIDDDLNIEEKEYRFAIIVPNCNNDHGEYNGKTFLGNCIESILNQTYKNFYLIFVDDMSTDSSIKTVKSYKDDRIHIIQNRRKRYNGGSRNVGIEYALDNLKIDYFCFIDSDDWWKDNTVLDTINRKLHNHDMMILGSEMIFEDGTTVPQYNKYSSYEDVFFCLNNVWCTAWSRVVRKDKIVYFEESTLMEDRVWSYKLADNIDYNNITHLNKICYVWNRLNTTNSVSVVRGGIWDASAYCHIGHQLMLLDNLKHEEMRNKLQRRINECKNKVNMGEYQQY